MKSHIINSFVIKDGKIYLLDFQGKYPDVKRPKFIRNNRKKILKSLRRKFRNNVGPVIGVNPPNY